jgi:2-keto-4-pentenoate hydratase/2-oxohepta-3-ene-1,7-dioic acid hydratase in catechol pathway
MWLMRRSPVALSLIFSALLAGASLVSDKPDTPFKLATFEAQGKTRVGMALGDRMLDLNGANAYVEKQIGLPALRLPMEMRELIEQYPATSKRMYQIANYLKDKRLDGQAFALALDKVAIKAPIKYPYNLMNMAANYWTHAREMGVNKDVDQDRDDPFIFAKSPRSCIVDPGTPFYIPEGRDHIDWEGELAIIVSKPAFRVSKQKALDYVFGYSIMYDVSDRGGRHRKDPMFTGPDWFSGKSLDGAAPFGPFIVPKEFMTHPHDIHIMTRVNGVVKQDGNTSDMIYDVEHQVAYISSIMTLYPGDVISSGTMGGVGVARKPQEFLKPGDVVEISIDGIGTLKTPIAAMSQRPAPPAGQ